MPITKTITLYQYDELPTEEAKERARDWFRTVSADHSFYSEFVVEDFERICAALGIEPDTRRGGRTITGRDRVAVYWSGFWSQGDGASFAGTFRAKPDAGDAIRAYAPQDERLHAIGDALAALSVRFPDLYARIVQGGYGGHYVHEMTMSVDVEVGEDDDGIPLDNAAPIDDEITELFRDLARWLYRTLEAAYEDENADENVAENIRANEYTFTESGKRED